MSMDTRTAATDGGMEADDNLTLQALARKYGPERVRAELVKFEAEGRAVVRDDIAPNVAPTEGPERFEAQHKKALEALAAFGVEHGAPTWEAVLAKLTPDVLRAAERMKEPKLVLTPPLTRQQLVAAVDARKGKLGIKSETYTYNLGDDDLYNNGQPEANLAWEVHVVEGMQDVSVNEAVQYSNGRPLYNHQQVRGLMAHYKAMDLGVLSGARPYLALMMQGLVAKKPTDKDFWTVLNADVVAKDEKNESLLGDGSWDVGQVNLRGDNPGSRSDNLRVRAAVRV